MGECKHCPLKDNKFVLYEDKEVIAKLHHTPATLGHVIITTKEHYPIIEQVPDEVVGKIFSVSNKISSALFDSLNSHGTNIIIQNGVAAGQNESHFMVHVIARRENDGLNFQWVTKQLSEDEMGLAEMQIKEAAANVGVDTIQKTETIEEKKDVEKLGGEENYLIKQLYRLP